MFRDRDELAASADLDRSVREALAESETLIVICSPNGARSKWVNAEIRAFTALGRRSKIQCLIVGGEPHASTTPGGDPALECFPPALFEEGAASPLAADIRPGQDTRQAAKLKILASLLGIKYDDLRQRDAARRARRQATIATILGGALLIMSALAVYAFASRAEAVRQRDLARRKTITAERTVDFVKGLFQVADPSESRGDTITAREILDRGARKIQTELASEPSVKAELSTTLGEVYAGLGLYKEGETLIRGSLPLKPVDASTRARQYVALAEAQDRQGDDTAAVSSFRRALTFAATDPDLEKTLVSRILVGLGVAQSNLGDNDAADRSIRRALVIDERESGPRSPDVARDLEELGGDAASVRHYAEARADIARALEIRLATQGERHPKVSEDMGSLGVIAYFQGDAAAAETYYRRAMAADVILLGPDHPDAATTINSYARLLVERRAYGEADKLLRHVVDVVLRQRNDKFEDLAYVFDNLGLAEEGLGRDHAAESLFNRALSVARAHNHRNLAPILADLADVTCGHDPARGLGLLREAAPIMAKTFPDDPWRSAWVETVRGRCLLASGDSTGAFAALTSSHVAIRARWSPGSLYGARADDLLAEARTAMRKRKA